MLKIAIASGLSAIVLAASPASAEICSNFGTRAFDGRGMVLLMQDHTSNKSGSEDARKERPQNVPERDAEILVKQIMSPGWPVTVHRGGAEEGWPCAGMRRHVVPKVIQQSPKGVKDVDDMKTWLRMSAVSKGAASAAKAIGRATAQAVQEAEARRTSELQLRMMAEELSSAERSSMKDELALQKAVILENGAPSPASVRKGWIADMMNAAKEAAGSARQSAVDTLSQDATN